MRKRKKTTLQEETLHSFNRLPEASLVSVRGGDGTEPSPDDDNEMRGHLIEIG